jgi:tetratricopeptide (TPR) repeat protein
MPRSNLLRKLSGTDAAETGHMGCVDLRGVSLSGATPSAMLAYECALAAFQSWLGGADEPLSVALTAAPNFVMAHVLQAYQLLGSRDPQHVRAARPVLARAAGLPLNESERLHLAAIAAVLADDYEGAKDRLGEALTRQPRDVLALQMAHSFDYITGETVRARDRIAAVLPAWSSSMPGYHAVLAMYAFSLVECGEYECAEQAARAALAQNADDARAYHAMAHVFEMTDRAEAGVHWMMKYASHWNAGTVVATHCWWHLALFQLVLGRTDRALDLYDLRIRGEGSNVLAGLIDSTALLWRLELLGQDTGARFTELADAWASRIDDGFCSFSDVHAMLAFVGARDWERARQLEKSLVRAQAQPTRHGNSTRQLGLPACRALIAFGHENDGLAISLLANLPAFANRLGGSHAQRDVVHLTLLRAIERIRRPARGSLARQGCDTVWVDAHNDR